MAKGSKKFNRKSEETINPEQATEHTENINDYFDRKVNELQEKIDLAKLISDSKTHKSIFNQMDALIDSFKKASLDVIELDSDQEDKKRVIGEDFSDKIKAFEKHEISLGSDIKKGNDNAENDRQEKSEVSEVSIDDKKIVENIEDKENIDLRKSVENILIQFDKRINGLAISESAQKDIEVSFVKIKEKFENILLDSTINNEEKENKIKLLINDFGDDLSFVEKKEAETKGEKSEELKNEVSMASSISSNTGPEVVLDDTIIELEDKEGLSKSEELEEDKEGQEKNNKVLNDTAKEYLMYLDVLPGNADAVLTPEFIEKTNNYAIAFEDIKNDPNFETITSEIRKKFNNAIEKAGIKTSIYGVSASWIYWDLAKQKYINDNPDEQDSRYRIADPMKDVELQDQITSRHLGWEIYDAFRAGNIPKLDQKNPNYSEIMSFLNKKAKDNATLSSIDLTRLGALIRDNLEEKDVSVPDILQNNTEEVSESKESIEFNEDNPINLESLELKMGYVNIDSTKVFESLDVDDIEDLKDKMNSFRIAEEELEPSRIIISDLRASKKELENKIALSEREEDVKKKISIKEKNKLEAEIHELENKIQEAETQALPLQKKLEQETNILNAFYKDRIVKVFIKEGREGELKPAIIEAAAEKINKVVLDTISLEAERLSVDNKLKSMGKQMLKSLPLIMATSAAIGSAGLAIPITGILAGGASWAIRRALAARKNKKAPELRKKQREKVGENKFNAMESLFSDSEDFKGVLSGHISNTLRQVTSVDAIKRLKTIESIEDGIVPPEELDEVTKEFYLSALAQVDAKYPNLDKNKRENMAIQLAMSLSQHQRGQHESAKRLKEIKNEKPALYKIIEKYNLLSSSGRLKEVSGDMSEEEKKFLTMSKYDVLSLGIGAAIGVGFRMDLTGGVVRTGLGALMGGGVGYAIGEEMERKNEGKVFKEITRLINGAEDLIEDLSFPSSDLEMLRENRDTVQARLEMGLLNNNPLLKSRAENFIHNFQKVELANQASIEDMMSTLKKNTEVIEAKIQSDVSRIEKSSKRIKLVTIVGGTVLGAVGGFYGADLFKGALDKTEDIATDVLGEEVVADVKEFIADNDSLKEVATNVLGEEVVAEFKDLGGAINDRVDHFSDIVKKSEAMADIKEFGDDVAKASGKAEDWIKDVKVTETLKGAAASVGDTINNALGEDVVSEFKDLGGAINDRADHFSDIAKESEAMADIKEFGAGAGLKGVGANIADTAETLGAKAGELFDSTKEVETTSATEEINLKPSTAKVDIIDSSEVKGSDSIWKSTRTIFERNPSEFGFEGDVNNLEAVSKWAETQTANAIAILSQEQGGDLADLVHDGDKVILEVIDGKPHLSFEASSGIETGHLPVVESSEEPIVDASEDGIPEPTPAGKIHMSSELTGSNEVDADVEPSKILELPEEESVDSPKVVEPSDSTTEVPSEPVEAQESPTVEVVNEGNEVPESPVTESTSVAEPLEPEAPVVENNSDLSGEAEKLEGGHIIKTDLPKGIKAIPLGVERFMEEHNISFKDGDLIGLKNIDKVSFETVGDIGNERSVESLHFFENDDGSIRAEITGDDKTDIFKINQDGEWSNVSEREFVDTPIESLLDKTTEVENISSEKFDFDNVNEKYQNEEDIVELRKLVSQLEKTIDNNQSVFDTAAEEANATAEEASTAAEEASTVTEEFEKYKATEEAGLKQYNADNKAGIAKTFQETLGDSKKELADIQQKAASGNLGTIRVAGDGSEHNFDILPLKEGQIGYVETSDGYKVRFVYNEEGDVEGTFLKKSGVENYKLLDEFKDKIEEALSDKDKKFVYNMKGDATEQISGLRDTQHLLENMKNSGQGDTPEAKYLVQSINSQLKEIDSRYPYLSESIKNEISHDLNVPENQAETINDEKINELIDDSEIDSSEILDKLTAKATESVNVLNPELEFNLDKIETGDLDYLNQVKESLNVSRIVAEQHNKIDLAEACKGIIEKIDSRIEDLSLKVAA